MLDTPGAAVGDLDDIDERWPDQSRPSEMLAWAVVMVFVWLVLYCAFTLMGWTDYKPN